MEEQPRHALEKWSVRFAAAGVLAIVVPLMLVAAALIVAWMALNGY